MKKDSYCRPDVDGMRERIKHEVEAFHKSGRKLDDIAYCMLMDEPTGQSASFMAQDDGYRDRFRAWLKGLGISLKDLLEPDWEAVRPVVETQRDQHPALHYFTQRFRTVAIGDFMATQKRSSRKLTAARFRRMSTSVTGLSTTPIFTAKESITSSCSIATIRTPSGAKTGRTTLRHISVPASTSI